MDRRVILGNLIHPQRWVVLPHETGIGMAAATDIHDLRSRGFADVSLGGVHGAHFRVRGIATVAGNAAEAFDRVNISTERLRRLRKPRICEALMAGKAIFSLLLADCGGRQE